MAEPAGHSRTARPSAASADLDRRQHVAHGIEQPARIEGDADHRAEIDRAVDQQGRAIVAKQRRQPHLVGDGRRTRGGKQRSHGQIADGGEQQPGLAADGCTQGIHTAPNLGQRHHGEHRQADRRQQEAGGGAPHLLAGLQPHHGREDDVAGTDEEREGHEAQRDYVSGC